jgi:hypothetical protein
LQHREDLGSLFLDNRLNKRKFLYCMKLKTIELLRHYQSRKIINQVSEIFYFSKNLSSFPCHKRCMCCNPKLWVNVKHFQEKKFQNFFSSSLVTQILGEVTSVWRKLISSLFDNFFSFLYFFHSRLSLFAKRCSSQSLLGDYSNTRTTIFVVAITRKKLFRERRRKK